jgi:hypothetical protein
MGRGYYGSSILSALIIAFNLLESTLGQALWSRGNYSSVPPQLNQSSFAFCLSNGDDIPDISLEVEVHNLTIDDGLLLYLR